MSNNNRFDRGDIVSHPKRPQWGAGVVRDVSVITHEGRPAQRLTIDFANHGRVVINTGVAALVPKDQVDSSSSAPLRFAHSSEVSNTMTANGTQKGWLDQLEQARGLKQHELWELPDDMTDPFSTEWARLVATLRSFQYSTEARSLIDWAVAQTGLDDPMTRYTRQELEQNFQRFAHNRDQHLKELVRSMKRMGEQKLLQQTMSQLQNAAAREALKKAIRA